MPENANKNLIDKLLVLMEKAAIFNEMGISKKTPDSIQFECKTPEGETYSFEIGRHINDISDSEFFEQSLSK